MDKKALLIKMDATLHKRLKLATTKSEDTMTSVVLKLIEEYLKKVEEKK